MFEATQSETVYMKNTEEESRNVCKSEDGSWIRNMAAVLLLRYLQIKSCFLMTSVNWLEQLLFCACLLLALLHSASFVPSLSPQPQLFMSDRRPSLSQCSKVCRKFLPV